MPKLALTDLSIKNLHADKQTDFWDTKLPSFGIRVGPRSKTFIVKVGNSRRAIGIYPSISLQYARKQAHIQKIAPAPSSLSPTFSEAYELFSSIHVVTKKRNTQDNYRGAIERNFLKPFVAKRLDHITYRDIISITDKLSPSSKAYALVVIRIFWNFCRRRQLTKNNPVDTVQVEQSATRDRVLSDRELRCIWRACELKQHVGTSSFEDAASAQPINTTFAAIVKLLILTGQRRGEITNLQASWIRDNQITLPKEITKNGREHTFPIGITAQKIIKEFSDTNGRPDTILFPARGTSSPVVTPFNGFSKCKVALDKKLGPDFKPWTLHDLRRTYATGLAKLGVRIEVTEKLLNHVSGTMSGIVGIYQRYDFMDQMRDAVLQWEAKLETILSDVGDVQM